MTHKNAIDITPAFKHGNSCFIIVTGLIKPFFGGAGCFILHYQSTPSKFLHFVDGYKATFFTTKNKLKLFHSPALKLYLVYLDSLLLYYLRINFSNRLFGCLEV